MHNFTLIMNMTLFFGFGASGSRSKHLKFGLLYFYSLAPGMALGSPGKKFREIPVGLPGASE